MLYPLRVTPIYKTAIWGGRKLESLLGRQLPEGNRFAESWDVSGHPAGVSTISNGPLAGQTIQDILDNYRTQLLGPHAQSGFTRFPLMVKFLDAEKQLSVQVHPNEDYVRLNQLSDTEKAEAWVVLNVVPGSKMTLGFQRPVSKKEIASAVRNAALETILFELEPKPGECFFLPAGTVHSLGAGIFLYEIQQCSNLTFRLYDWNRTDEYGQRRQLHVTQALDSIELNLWKAEPIKPLTQELGRELLIQSAAFNLERHTFSEETVKQYTLDCSKSCRVLTVLQGALKVQGLENPLRLGESVILPAVLGKVLLESESAVVLDAFLPAREKELKKIQSGAD